MLMKRAVMKGPKQTVLEVVPVPSIAPDEILVRMKYCGVCRSEHDAWKEAWDGRLLGHEPVGVIEKVGCAITNFVMGDKVSGLSHPTLAEYVVFKEKYTVKIPDELSVEDAMGGPLACLVSVISKLPLSEFAEKVAVVGCGFMGLWAISLHKMKNTVSIIAVDVREEARQNALEMGDDEAYHPNEVPSLYPATWENGCEGGLPIMTEWTENEQELDLAGRMTRTDGVLSIGSYLFRRQTQRRYAVVEL